MTNESQQIYQSSFLKMYLDKESSFLELRWSDPKEKMDKDAFRKEMIAYRDTVVKHKIVKVLNNSLGGSFVMTPEIQEWIAAEIFPYTIQSLRKIAFVMPWDLIQKLAMSQMIEEYEVKDEKHILESRYFKNAELASQWLFS